MICYNDNVLISIDLWVRQRFHININVNATNLTKPNNMLFCFVQIGFNGYSKTAFDLQIASDRCHKINRMQNQDLRNFTRKDL